MPRGGVQKLCFPQASDKEGQFLKMEKRIGLCGSHRTGKTTLAELLSEKLNIPFLKTRTSEVFKENGLNPSEPMDFSTRLWIQERVLADAESIWNRGVTSSFITDRTPLDMMAYLLADIQGATPSDHQDLTKYLDESFRITNHTFTHLFVIQPAIPLIYETGKAPLNRSYMEHLNAIIRGLCLDERLTCPFWIIKRHVQSISDRVQEIFKIINPP